MPPPPSGADHLSNRDLKAAAYHGARWTALSRVGVEVSGLVSMVVVARLVEPAAFGRVAVASIALQLASALLGEGLRVPLVQRAHVEHEHVEAATLLALLGGIALALLTAVVVPPIAAAVLDSETAELLRLTALAFLVTGIVAVAQGTLLRRLAFRTVALTDTLTALVTALATIGLAVLGLEATALLLGPIAGQAITAAVLLVVSPLPWPRWRSRALRELLGFGLPSMANGAAWTMSRNIDYVVLAGRLDAATVGFYWRGFAFGIDYQRKVSAVVQKLALPLYARTETIADKRLLRSRIVRLQALAIFPLVTGLIVTAPVVVPFVLGPQWEPAVLPTQILAVAGLVNAVETGVGPLLLALGHPGALLRWNLWNLVLFALVVYVAAPLGLVGVCIAVVAFRLARFGFSLSLMMRRLAGIPVLDLWHDIAPPAFGSAVLAGAGFGLVAAAGALGLPDWTWAVAFGVLAPALYLGFLRWCFPDAFRQLLETGRAVLPASLRVRGGDGGAATTSDSIPVEQA